MKRGERYLKHVRILPGVRIRVDAENGRFSKEEVTSAEPRRPTEGEKVLA